MGDGLEKGPRRLSLEMRAQIELRDEIERMHEATDPQERFWCVQGVCARISLIPRNSYAEVLVTADGFRDLRGSMFARIERPYIATNRLVKVGALLGGSQLTVRALGGHKPQIVFQEVSSEGIGREILVDPKDFLSAKIVYPQPPIVKTS